MIFLSKKKIFNKKEKILLYSSTLWHFGAGMLGPFFAVFTERVGGDLLDIAWVWAVYLMVTGVSIIVIGKISDKRVKKANFLFLGYCLNAFFTFAYLFVSSPIGLLIVQTGLGVAAALAIPTWDELYAEHEYHKKGGITWGLAEGMSQIAAGLAIILGGLIITYFSFDVLFLLMGTVQLMATLYQAKFVRR